MKEVNLVKNLSQIHLVEAEQNWLPFSLTCSIKRLSLLSLYDKKPALTGFCYDLGSLFYSSCKQIIIMFSDNYVS